MRNSKFLFATLLAVAVSSLAGAQITAPDKALVGLGSSPISATDPMPAAYGYLILREHGGSVRAPIVGVYRQNEGPQMYFILDAVKDTTMYEVTINPNGLGGGQFKPKGGGSSVYLTIYEAGTPVANPPQLDTIVTPANTPNATTSGMGAFYVANGHTMGTFHVMVSNGTRSIKLDGSFVL